MRITPRAMYLPEPLTIGDLGVVRSTGVCENVSSKSPIVLVEFVMQRQYWMLAEAVEVVG